MEVSSTASLRNISENNDNESNSELEQKEEKHSDSDLSEQLSSNASYNPKLDSIKKKRGRKRKNPDGVENNSSENIDKDHSSDYNMFTTSMSSINNITKIKSEPVENDTLHLSCDETNISSDLNKSVSNVPSVKRGRGRPRKSFSAHNHQTLIGKAKKGLNKVTEDEDKSVSSSLSSGYRRGGFKRGRGRPRKSVESSAPVTTPANLSEQNSSKHHVSYSGSKRRIIKPKRFESYESFDFMDVNDRNICSSNNTSFEEQDDDSDAFQIVEEDEALEDKSVEGVNELDNEGGDGDAKPKVKRQRIMKKRKRLFLRPSALERDEENEFDAFGKNVALQLKLLPLQDALELQIEILSLISHRRL